jgi:hypothetical protein
MLKNQKTSKYGAYIPLWQQLVGTARTVPLDETLSSNSLQSPPLPLVFTCAFTHFHFLPSPYVFQFATSAVITRKLMKVLKRIALFM